MIEELKGQKDVSLETIMSAIKAEGIEIRESPNRRAPETLDQSGFEDLMSYQWREIQELANNCAEYLSGPLIVDTFTVHDQRREWRKKMRMQFGSAFVDFNRKNKLRGNTIYSLARDFGYTSETVAGMSEQTERSKKFIEIADKFPDIGKYGDTMPIEEKIQLTHQIDAVCDEMLRFLEGIITPPPR